MTPPAIRHGPGGTGRRVGPGLLVGLALLLGACGTPADSSDAPGSTSAATGTGAASVAGGSSTSSTTSTTTPAPPPRVAMFGDSTALMTSFGLAGWLLDTGRGVPVDGRVDLGCSILRGGLRRDHIGTGPNNPICDDRDATWREMVVRSAPTVAVVQTGPWDILDHQLPGETVWRSPGDPVFDDALRREMLAVVDILAADGAHVVWLTLPVQRMGVGDGPGGAQAPATEPARAERYNAMLAEAAGERPETLTVLDYAGWLAGSGLDETLRPDGIHVAFDTSRTTAELWLGDRIVEAGAAAWRREQA